MHSWIKASVILHHTPRIYVWGKVTGKGVGYLAVAVLLLFLGIIVA